MNGRVAVLKAYGGDFALREQALAFLRRNLRRFPYERLVSHVFPLARIGEAFQQADWMQRAGDGLRISRAALSMAD